MSLTQTPMPTSKSGRDSSGGVSDFPSEELAKILRAANVAGASGSRPAGSDAAPIFAAETMNAGLSARPRALSPDRPPVGPSSAGRPIPSGTDPVLKRTASAGRVSGASSAENRQASAVAETTGYPSYKERRRSGASPTTRVSPVSANAAPAKPASSDPAETSGKTRYPSWKERQRRNASGKSSARTPQSAKQPSDQASSEPSDLTKFMLVASGMLDDLMDVVTWMPGVSAVFAFISATIQITVIALDSNLRKQTVDDKAKLLFRRWLLIVTVSFVEGIVCGINLLPLQTLAGWAVRYIKSKERKLA